MGETHDLGLILDARIPLIVIESPDERRVLELLLRFAMHRGLGFYEWTVTRGLQRGGFGDEPPHREATLEEPEAVLHHIGRTVGPALYVLCDFHPFIGSDPKVTRLVKDVALDFEHLRNTVIFVSHTLEMPRELGRYAATFNLRLPSDEELMALVRSQAQEWAKQNRGKKVKTDSATLEKLIANLRGVSHADAQLLIRHAIFNDGAIQASDIPAINRLKFELLDSEGVLHFEYDTETFSQVAGLNNLKRWLSLRRESLLGNPGTDRPRGILLLGVQGSGKSLAAKSVAGHFGVPLLRLDFGTLYNKYFGETERNLRNSLKQAELMAPCVLWMDEVEKGLATGQSDNATSKRVLGTLLTWMAEHQSPVFLVATSNDISELPPELVRKGRFDEIFFVDLPDPATRREIFAIHLGRRGIATEDVDLDGLAELTDGFTGAEIEQAIVSARYLAGSRDRPLREEDIRSAVNGTYPMSVLRADAVHNLRAWAHDRTVPA